MLPEPQYASGPIRRWMTPDFAVVADQDRGVLLYPRPDADGPAEELADPAALVAALLAAMRPADHRHGPVVAHMLRDLDGEHPWLPGAVLTPARAQRLRALIAAHSEELEAP